MPTYDRAHQLRRAQALPNAWGQPCPRCGRVMLQGQDLDLDHGDPDSPGYLGMAHAVCNRRAGGRLGRERLKAKIRADRERRYVDIEACAIGVEISEDRLHTSIATASRRAGLDAVVIELVAYLDGTTVAPAAILHYAGELAARAVVIDPHSQAATLLVPLEQAKLKGLVKPSTSDVVVAHGQFLDELAAGHLRHVAHPRLDEAARAGEQRRLAGAQTWDRRVDADVSPLTAATLALWGLMTAKPKAPVVVE
ncbi:MAG TPA: hypothetical protein VJS45_01790 [Acidimicrobiia bacterium]|nr:hypothetical protein [Acidimicrobiia bacterium]